MTALTWSGYLAFAVAIAAWVGGAKFADACGNSDRFKRIFVALVLLVAAAQLGVSVLQFAGLHLFPLDPTTAALMGSRTNGTLNHPNNLGKVVLLLGGLAIPHTRDPDPRVERFAKLALLSAGLVVGFALGRATIFGFVMLVGVYFLMARGHGTLGKRLTWIVPIAVIILPFIPGISARFQEDPEGGSRDELTRRAMDYLEQHPWSGVGPNNYVHAINAATGSGNLPVHDSALLLAVELGIVGAALFFLPFVATWIQAVPVMRNRTPAGRYASALFALQLALIPVISTGWGMTSGYVLPLWTFSIGYLVHAMSNSKAKDKSESKWNDAHRVTAS